MLSILMSASDIPTYTDMSQDQEKKQTGHRTVQSIMPQAEVDRLDRAAKATTRSRSLFIRHAALLEAERVLGKTEVQA